MNKDEFITSGDICRELEKKGIKLTRQGLKYYEKQGYISPVQTLGRTKMYSRDTIGKVVKIKELLKKYRPPKILEMIKKGEL